MGASPSCCERRDKDGSPCTREQIVLSARTADGAREPILSARAAERNDSLRRDADVEGAFEARAKVAEERLAQAVRELGHMREARTALQACERRARRAEARLAQAERELREIREEAALRAGIGGENGGMVDKISERKPSLSTWYADEPPGTIRPSPVPAAVNDVDDCGRSACSEPADVNMRVPSLTTWYADGRWQPSEAGDDPRGEVKLGAVEVRHMEVMTDIHHMETVRPETPEPLLDKSALPKWCAEGDPLLNIHGAKFELQPRPSWSDKKVRRECPEARHVTAN